MLRRYLELMFMVPLFLFVSEEVRLESVAFLQELPPIGVIQGPGDVSPLLQQRVTFRGVVTGFYEDQNTNGITFYTLFVQDLPGQEDQNPNTSDGIAVFLGRDRPIYQIGNQLLITGLVTEFFGFTEIDDNNLKIVVEQVKAPLPEPILIKPPVDNDAQLLYFEKLESMLVFLEGSAQVVGPTYSGCGFAVVDQDKPLERIIRHRKEDPVGQIVPVLHNSDVLCADFPHVKSGDMVKGLQGPLIFNFDQFKVVQQDPAALQVTISPLQPVPAPPELTTGQISLVTLNLDNHFDNIDHTGDQAEPKPSTDEIRLKEKKLAHLIAQTLACPTIIGIQEVENAALLSALAATTAESCGFIYQVTHQESADLRGIDVALLTDPRQVKIMDHSLHQGCTILDTEIRDESVSCPGEQQPLFSRPPLRVEFEISELKYVVFINHFKSKRGGEEATAPRRLAQADHMMSLVADLLRAKKDQHIIVLGDFNDYDQSPAMLRLTSDGRLTNIFGQVPEKERYSLIFGGVSQLIDTFLLSTSLVGDVVAARIFHVNADYPDVLATDISLAGLPYRATDHDVPLLVLNIKSADPPVIPTLASRTPLPLLSPTTSTSLVTPTLTIPAPLVTPTATTPVPLVKTPTTVPKPAPSSGENGIGWPIWLVGALFIVMVAGGLIVYKRQR